MDGRLLTCDGVRRGLLLLAVLVLVLDLGILPAQGAGFAPVNSARETIGPPPPALVAWSWESITSPLDRLSGSRRRMIQIATVGMCIGLYILMRR